MPRPAAGFGPLRLRPPTTRAEAHDGVGGAPPKSGGRPGGQGLPGRAAPPSYRLPAVGQPARARRTGAAPSTGGTRPTRAAAVKTGESAEATMEAMSGEGSAPPGSVRARPPGRPRWISSQYHRFGAGSHRLPTDSGRTASPRPPSRPPVSLIASAPSRPGVAGSWVSDWLDKFSGLSSETLPVRLRPRRVPHLARVRRYKAPTIDTGSGRGDSVGNPCRLGRGRPPGRPGHPDRRHQQLTLSRCRSPAPGWHRVRCPSRGPWLRRSASRLARALTGRAEPAGAKGCRCSVSSPAGRPASRSTWPAPSAPPGLPSRRRFPLVERLLDCRHAGAAEPGDPA